MSRLDVRNKFDAGQALLVNHVAEDYRFLLKKIMALISIIPSTCKCLIVPLPKGAKHIDQFFAKRIQRIMSSSSDGFFMILFISYESHRELVSNFYRISKNQVVAINTVVNMTAGFSEGTLMYSWGSAAFGKLGLGLSSENDCMHVSEFMKEDLARVKLNVTDSDAYQYFTYSPQPIVSFLGMKVKAVDAGLHHFLALTTAGELFAWGDNSQCQLGLDEPDACVPPNHYDKTPIILSTAEKP